ncbi:MAG TPA: CDP-alcohol phosphatidyltransferase family protein [Armatimonadota bacterium]|nr:CDP-alcohol phosphatidyltransferase family protein [Armatimonadota bacterium]
MGKTAEMRSAKCWVANAVTLARIPLAVSLLWIPPLGTPFVAIYLLCGISDMVDGFIARKTRTTSALGAKLDSTADFIMVAVLIGILYPVIRPPLPILIWIVLIAVLRFAAVGVVWVKHHSLSMLHTYGNKVTGFLLFLFPLAMAALPTTVPIYIVCVAASLSAIEELLIDIASDALDPNRKSIFVRER